MSLDKYMKKEGGELPEPTNTAEVPAKTPITLGGRIFIFCFGLIFFAVGCAAVWHMAIKPLRLCDAAQSWPVVEVLIERSTVASNTDSDNGTTYSAELLYSYTYTGHSYKSSRYNINKISSGDYGAAQRVVDLLPVGTRTTAYVNPADPYYAILVRSKSAWDYFGFVFLIFVLVGGGIMSAAFAPSLPAGRQVSQVFVRHRRGLLLWRRRVK